MFRRSESWLFQLYFIKTKAMALASVNLTILLIISLISLALNCFSVLVKSGPFKFVKVKRVAWLVACKSFVISSSQRIK